MVNLDGLAQLAIIGFACIFLILFPAIGSGAFLLLARIITGEWVANAALGGGLIGFFPAAMMVLAWFKKKGV